MVCSYFLPLLAFVICLGCCQTLAQVADTGHFVIVQTLHHQTVAFVVNHLQLRTRAIVCTLVLFQLMTVLVAIAALHVSVAPANAGHVKGVEERFARVKAL